VGSKTGALAVESGGQQQVLDQGYAAARIKEPGRVETGTVTPQEVQQAFGPALAAQPVRPASFTVYFLEGKDEFTPESRQIITQIVANIATRPAPEIIVIGHTDRVGTVAANDALSLRRAGRVRDEFVKLGIPPDRITVAGRGEREPLVPTGDGVAEPRNRRVEINVR
jgi:outer membrane protein OmpA-like peptidoglycan-associated protein